MKNSTTIIKSTSNSATIKDFKTDNSETESKFCYIGVFGAPNVGKSTLMNCLIGRKCSIVSPRPHTTQKQVVGVLNKGNSQIAFIDTPGVSFSRGNSRFLESESTNNMIILDVSSRSMSLDYRVVSHLSKSFAERENSNLIIVLNKIDKVDKLKLLPMIQELSIYSSNIFPISAKKGSGVNELLNHVVSLAQSGRWLFDNYTNESLNFLVTEEVREKLLLNTHKEIPFTSRVRLDQAVNQTVNDEEVVEFYVNIMVEKDNHKGIIIGKGGSMIKKIGETARLSLQDMLNKKVRLFLNVSLQRDTNAAAMSH